MTTIGQVLTTPESGWKAYNNTHPSFIYSGWTNGAHASYFSGDRSLSNTAGSYFTFKFKGTKLRIIGALGPSDSTNIKVSIDGVEENYSTKNTVNTSNIFQALVYEKTGLTDTIHEVTVTNMVSASTAFDALHIDSAGDMVVPLGSSLISPDIGWKRYDERNQLIKFEGTWSVLNGSDYYNSTLTYLTAIGSNKVKFGFKGTKIRLIGSFTDSTTSSSSDLQLVIDGTPYIFSNYRSTGFINQALLVEVEGLPNKWHNVEIKGDSNSKYFAFDAFDIDEDGEFRDPIKKSIIENNSSFYSLDNKTLTHLPSSSDKNMILHGIESGKEIKLDEDFDKMVYVQDNSEVLGEGNVFTHTLNKKKVNKITF